MLHPDFNALGEPSLTRSAVVNKLSRNSAHDGCSGLSPKVSVTQGVRCGAVRKTPSLSAMSGFRDFRSRLMSERSANLFGRSEASLCHSGAKLKFSLRTADLPNRSATLPLLLPTNSFRQLAPSRESIPLP
jgi:hypothetical protein